MPANDDMWNSLTGAWHLMTGRKDGLERLDLSLDGFWNSFLAMAVALPPLTVSWTGLANEINPGPAFFVERLSLMPRLAVIDFATWIAPFIVLAATAKYAGLAGRFVHYVVATNWMTAIIAWIMMPPALARLVFPATGAMVSFIGLGIFILSLVFGWRVTNAALNRGPVVASVVFVAMFIVELITVLILQSAFGLRPVIELPQ